MKMTIAAKKIGSSWEGALITEGKFQHALSGDKLEDVILRGLVAALLLDLPTGTDVLLDMTTETPEEVEKAKQAKGGQK